MASALLAAISVCQSMVGGGVGEDTSSLSRPWPIALLPAMVAVWLYRSNTAAKNAASRSTGQPYTELGGDYYAKRRPGAVISKALHQLRAAGITLTFTGTTEAVVT